MRIKSLIEKMILVAVFLSPCSDIFVFKTGFIDLKILQFIWGAIVILILIQRAADKRYQYIRKNNKNEKVIFTYYLLGIILSFLFSINMRISGKEFIQYGYLFLIMLIVYTYAEDKEFFNKVISVIILSNILLVSISIISYFSGKLLIPSFVMYPNGALYVADNLYKTQALIESNNIINRLEGVMGLGATAIANCILIHSLLINYKIRKSTGRLRIIYLFLFLANIIIVGITYSRAALIIFIFINFVTLLGENHKVNIVLIFIAICSIPIILSFFPNVLERLLEAFNPQEGSTKYHFVYWLMALREGYDYIFTGIGLGNAAFQQDMYADMFRNLFRMFDLYNADGANIHNFILQIWAEQGSLGLLANVILVLSPIINFIKGKFISNSIRGKSIYDFIILAYISTLLYNLTNNSFYIETFWVIMALGYTCKLNYIANPVKRPIKILCKGDAI